MEQTGQDLTDLRPLFLLWLIIILDNHGLWLPSAEQGSLRITSTSLMHLDQYERTGERLLFRRHTPKQSGFTVWVEALLPPLFGQGLTQ